MIRQLVLVAAGGALGALARYGVGLWVGRATTWPAFAATAGVNLTGSLAMGVLYVVIVERLVLHPDWRALLLVGLLGAFTTFSTFSLELVLQLQQGRWVLAAVYAAASVVLCVGGCAAGVALARVALNS